MNQSQAQLRNVAARRLIARNRLREALDVLNDAIRMDPRWAESYDNRATVFERMGMHPQAEADRRKVDELGGVVEPEPIAPPPPPDPATPRRRMPPAAPAYPAATKPRGANGAAFRALGTVLITVGLFVAAGIGIFLALNTLTDAINDDDETVGAPSQAADGSETPGASDGATDGGDITPTPTLPPEAPEEALQGSPLSFSRLQAAWRDKQFDVETDGINPDVRGFKTSPVNVTLSRGGAEMQIAVLLYDSPDEMRAEWDVGAQVVPKGSATIPAGAFAWANINAVVVVVSPDDSIRNEARDAFLAISA